MPDWRQEVRRRLASAPAQVIDEIAGHLEDRHAELAASGLPPAEIEAQVLAELDGSDLAELARPRSAPPPAMLPGAGSGRRLADLWGDFRYGVRQLRINRSFTVVTLLSLALGIGATLTIFQFLDALHLRALPVERPQELAVVKKRNDEWGSGDFNGWHPHFTNPLWEQLRQRQEAFAGLLAWGDDNFNLNSRGEARWAHGLMVSGDFFRVLGVQPFIGRFFTARDDRRGCGNPGVVVSYGFWRRELGGDPAAVGRQITLDGHALNVIGVSPRDFFGPEVGRSYDVAVPLCLESLFGGEDDRLDRRHSWWLAVMGRLKPGWTLERASAHLEAISRSLLEPTVPPRYPPRSVEKYLAYRFAAYPAATGLSQLREMYSTQLYLLFGVAGLLLLIACANLANLLLARASVREREIAVRLALGASRGRLIRQLLTESLLLALLGSGLGLVMARGLGEFLVVFLERPGRPALFVDLTPDWRLLAFTVGMAALTCLLFGLAPALRASRTDLGLVLKATTGRGATERGGRFALRRTLVVVQVALSFVLLSGAVLFSRSLYKLVTVDAGFQTSGVVIVEMDMSSLELPREQRIARKQELLERLRAVPGIERAASTTIVPISGSGWNNEVWHEGGERIQSQFSRISAGYFQTLGTPLLAGRDFDPGDRLSAPKVAIINQTLAAKLGLGTNPVGQRFSVSVGIGDRQETREIVGLVHDTKYKEMREPWKSITFVPAGQDEEPDLSSVVLVRSGLRLADLRGGITDAVAAVAPSVRLDFLPMDAQVSYSLLRDRMMAMLAAFFGLLAALLASIGLYGVIAYSVARRTQEIGIRMALGADPRRVTRMIVGEAGRLLGAGLVVGLVLALVAARTTAAFLYGLKSYDPATFAGAVALMGLCAFAASALPARRAARVDPMTVLRAE
jgi:predicted permease